MCALNEGGIFPTSARICTAFPHPTRWHDNRYKLCFGVFNCNQRFALVVKESVVYFSINLLILLS
jgi:hypothetical protein